jgi:anti-sigma-K factor RskA
MMSGLPHDQIEELIVADALDGLDEAGRLELTRLRAEHGPQCVECRRLEADYLDVAGQLATAVEPIPLSPGDEEALMRAAISPGAPPAAPEALAPRRFRPIQGGRRAQRVVAAVAVAASVALLGGLAGYAIAPKSTPLASVSYRSGAQQLTIVYVKGQAQALAIGSNLPTPEGGRVYELWYQPSKGADMRPAGTFVPRNGTVVAPVRVATSFVALAMTIEPPGGSLHPTSNPIFVQPT